MNTSQELRAQIYDHIKEPEVKDIYKYIVNEPYKTLKLGEEYLPKAVDKLSVLYAMQRAVEYVIGDLKEHGKANEELYGRYDSNHFNKQLKDIAVQIADLQKKGEKSTVYDEYESKSGKLEKNIYEAQEIERRARNARDVEENVTEYLNLLQEKKTKKLSLEYIKHDVFGDLLFASRVPLQSAIDSENKKALETILETLDIQELERFVKERPVNKDIVEEVVELIKKGQSLLEK